MGQKMACDAQNIIASSAMAKHKLSVLFLEATIKSQLRHTGTVGSQWKKPIRRYRPGITLL